MHDQPIQDRPTPGGSPTTAEQDLRSQRIVLTHVLTLHPLHLEVPELVREIGAGVPEFSEGDGIERAVGDLAGLGLLNRPGGLVAPTHAALRVYELLEG